MNKKITPWRIIALVCFGALVVSGASTDNPAAGTRAANAALQNVAEKFALLPSSARPIAPFKIQPYLAVASALQSMPRDQALAQLRSWAGNRQCGDQVRYLCGLLFTGKEGKNLRGPLFGEPGFMGGTDAADWPKAPFTFVGSIPFVIVHGYTLAGLGEPAARYLAYCEAEGQWNTRQFPPVDDATLHKALDALLRSPVWKLSLRDDECQFLSDQTGLEPFAKPSGITVANPIPPPAPRPDPASLIKSGCSLTDIAAAYAQLRHQTLSLPSPLSAEKVLFSLRLHFGDQPALSDVEDSVVFRILLALHGVALKNSPDGTQVTATTDPAVAEPYLIIAGPVAANRLNPLLAAIPPKTVTVNAPHVSVPNAADWLARSLDCTVLLSPDLPPGGWIDVHADMVSMADAVTAFDSALWQSGVALQCVDATNHIVVAIPRK